MDNLFGRSMQKLIPDLNRLYIGKACNIPRFAKRAMQGYTYVDNGIAKNTGLNYIYRYAQDINNKYCLMMLSLEDNEDAVENWFKSVDKSIDYQKYNNSLQPQKTDYYYGKKM